MEHWRTTHSNTKRGIWLNIGELDIVAQEKQQGRSVQKEAIRDWGQLSQSQCMCNSFGVQ